MAKTKNSIKERIKITKNKKALYKVPGQSHAKVNKRTPQRIRKKETRKLDMGGKRVKELKHE